MTDSRDVRVDPALAELVRQTLPNLHDRVAAALVTPASTTIASIGCDQDAGFEIGSISKGITGLLYADALERQEISDATTLGELLDLGTGPIRDVRLGSLATHRSGLPGLPLTWDLMRRTWAMYRTGANPYGDTLAELTAQARTLKVGKPKPRYSNVGYELLGHALGTAAGMTFAELLERRIATPLELEALYAPATEAELRGTALRGVGKRGRPQAPWVGEALGPAGGIRASIGDMAVLTRALANGTAPGLAALDPVAQFSGKALRIGAAWITLSHQGRDITWHNGGTGGFRTWIGLDREAGFGMVLLSATAASVDHYGFTLLHRAVQDAS